MNQAELVGKKRHIAWPQECGFKLFCKGKVADYQDRKGWFIILPVFQVRPGFYKLYPSGWRRRKKVKYIWR